MKDGFIKVAAGTPDVRVADCEFNATEIIRMVHEMEEQGAKVMVFRNSVLLLIPVEICSGRKIFWKRQRCSWYVLQKKLLMWTRLFL